MRRFWRRPKSVVRGPESATEPTASSGLLAPDALPRRGFLKRGAMFLLTGAFIAQGVALLRALWPDVLYEASKRFKVGLPAEIPEGISFIEARRLFVWCRANQFYAMSAVCTHLGCTVKPQATASGGTEFHCPCHGSRYREDGTNYAGPAPRPLDRYLVEISPDDGQLLVDSANPVDKAFRLTVRT